MTRFRSTLAPLLLLAVVVALWFWPATLTGRRPTGGDLTMLHVPAMTSYAQALDEGRVPLWDEQSGFGSPVLAQGQIGVLYPINQVLYRIFPARDAATASMCLHLILGAWFTYLCARGFELSRSASLLTGLVFSGQGFFIGHLTQAWSYSTGCWLPLAVVCTWRWLQSGRWSWLSGLAGVLAIQALAGHFQVLFFTILFVAALGVLNVASSQEARRTAARRGSLLVAGIVAGAALSAIQFVPTAELIMRGDFRDRGLDYASVCSSSPVMLVSYLAPTLLRTNPLWEPTIWIPSRTNANETLMWIGLLPMLLAVRTMIADRRERLVRIWTILLIGSVVLSLGASLPGFHLLTELPGLGWFPAPARWSVVSGLLMALLAGHAVDQVDVVLFCRWSRRCLGVLAVLLALGTAAIVISARSHNSFAQKPEPFLRLKLKDHGYSESELFEKPVTPASELNAMLIGELWLPVLNGTFLLALGFTRFWPATRERFAAIVIGWTAIEIGVVVHLLNPAQFEPRSPTPAESPVLSRLARSSPDRVAGTVGNLPLLAGVASSGQPARPAVSRFNAPGLTYLGESWPTIPEPARFGDHAYLLGYSGQTIEDDHVEFMRLSGIRMLVLGSSMSSVAFDERLQKADTISDERLTQMRFGPSLLQAGPIASRWQILELKPEVTCSRAWLFPVSDPPDAGTDPRLLMRPPPTRRRMLEKAVPVDRIDDHGEQVTIEGDCPSQSVLVLSDLHYPGWTATLDQEGESNDVPIQAAFGDWRAVHIPRGGRFELTFRYEPRSIRVGATISIGAVLLWLIGFGMAIFVERSRGTAVD